MVHSSRPEPDALLAHAAFVHAVARAALSGVDLADDVVQETWLAALRGGPRRRAALKPWLAGVARRQAANLLRKRSSQHRRDRRAARTELSPSTSDVAIRAETGRVLVEAVLSLDELHRDALLLRYYDNLAPRQIAARLGVPVQTVRTRVRRGLEKLRLRLGGSQEGERGGWSAALLLLVTEPGGGVGATDIIVGGGKLMAKKIAVAAAVLVLAGGSVVWFERAAREDPDPPPAVRLIQVEAPAPPPPGDELRPEVAEAPPIEAERPKPRLVGRTPSALPAAVKTPKAKPLPFAAGRVVSARGESLEGVLVLLRGEMNVLGSKQDDVIEPDIDPSMALATTASDGTFSVGEAPARRAPIVFLKPGWATQEVRNLSEDRKENQDLIVTLERGRRLEGFIRDTDGRPIPGANVVFHERPSHQRPRLSFRTRANGEGHYVLASLGDSPGWLAPTALDYALTQSRRVAGTARREDFTLQRTHLIVHVTDAVTGAHLSGAGGVVHDVDQGAVIEYLMTAETTILWRSAPYLLRARWPMLHGRRRTRRVGDATVFAPGYVPVNVRIDGRGLREPPYVEVALRRGESTVGLSGHVRGAPGACLEIRPPKVEFRVAGEEEGLPCLQRQTALPNGAFSFLGLTPGRYRLLVHAPGRGSLGLDVVAPAVDLDIALERAARLEVRALSPSGEPVPDAWVTVQPRSYHHRRTVQTGPGGIAHVDGLTAGEVLLIPERLGWGRAMAQHHFLAKAKLAPGESTRVDLRMPGLVKTVFQVQDADGAPVPGYAVRLMGMGHSMRVDVLKNVQNLELVADEDGLASTDLYPGPYRVRPATAKVGELETEFDVPLRGGPPVEVVVPSGNGVIFGSVREAESGDPIRHRRVMVGLLDTPGKWLGIGTTDAEGRFRVMGLPTGELRVVFGVRSKPGRIGIDPDTVYPLVYAEVTLKAAKSHRVDATVPRMRGSGEAERTVELDLRVRAAQTGKPLQGVHATLDGFMEGVWIRFGVVTTGPDGSARSLVPSAQKYRVHVRSPQDVDSPLRFRRMRLERKAVEGYLSVDVDLVLESDGN